MGDLSTPDGVQKLQTALHAKAKAEPGYRFYALYDKISREDVLAHAYAQCRSNQGAPGVDRQDFEDVEAHGLERWLGELALALRQETYRPDPIRPVYIPKATDVIDKCFLARSRLFFSRARVTARRKAGREAQTLPRSLHCRPSFAAPVRACLGPRGFQPATKRA